MSYEKQTWQTGDVVTSAKLNHMEDGIAGGGSGGGVLIVNVTVEQEGPDTFEVTSVSKTAEEIYSAASSGNAVFAYISYALDSTVAVLPLMNFAVGAENEHIVNFWSIDGAGNYRGLEIGDSAYAYYEEFSILNS